MKILIIDDDKTISLILGKVLDDLGIEFVHKLNGKEGLEEFMDKFEEGHPYDGVLLDIYMPDYDGLQILQGIREFEKENNLPPTCIAILTSSSNVGLAITSKKYGAEKFIHKDANTKQQIINLMKEKGCENEV